MRASIAAFEHALDEDQLNRRMRLAILKPHLRIGERHPLTRAVKRNGFDKDILELAAIGTGIHPEATTDGTRNAPHELKPRELGLKGSLRHRHVKNGSAGPQAMRPITRHVHEAAAEADHDALYAAITHKQVGAHANDQQRHIGGTSLQERRKVIRIGRNEQHISRTTRTKPGQVLDGCIGGVRSPHPRQPRQQRLR
jgi:hypothetical protein